MRPTLPFSLLPALALSACGDDGATATATDASTTATATATATTPPPTTATTDTPPTTTEAPVTTDPASASATDTDTGTTAASAPTTDTTVATDPATTAACLCAPGDQAGCQDGQVLVCADDCQGFVPQDCPRGQTCEIDTCLGGGLCVDGESECVGEDAVQTCNGGVFDPPVPCGVGESCIFGECTDACAQAEATPSSVGCSFFALRMDNYDYEDVDSLIVGNVSKSAAAKVQLYFVPDGTNVEQPQGAPVDLAPGATAQFQLTNAPMAKVSVLRKGGSYRVQSSIPVVAYQHSPIGAQATNDASMLLPEHALRQAHVVASYRDTVLGEDRPSYFDVIATADGTKVEWVPPIATVAGVGVPAVAPGQTGAVVLNRFDTLQVRAPDDADLSGTIVTADRPVWVVGAVNCTNVPADVYACDHIEEQLLPLDYWGKKYVGAHSPQRGGEKHHWRIYGGEDGTIVLSEPAVPGTPMMLDKGEWKDLVLASGTSTLFTGSKPFLPVQYLEGQEGGAGTGDPAMYQMIPVEQFLDRYAFVTGTGYEEHYVQVIREAGDPDVLVDGEVVVGYYPVSGYEVADWKVSEGGHLAESDAPFGIINVGYTGVTSYAYPGGMRLEIINPQ